jgi:SOS-response transcriptional repressor LexA
MGRIRESLNAIFADRKEIAGLTQKRLAEMMGAKPAMVSALLRGHRSLSEEWIERFCAALNITFGDLEEPSPRIHDPKELREYSDKLKRLYQISPAPGFRSAARIIDDWLDAAESRGRAFHPRSDGGQKDIAGADRAKESEILYTDSDAPRPVERIRVPHYEAIPAGDPREMNPAGQLWIEIVHSRSKDSWYTLRVSGDSMSPDYLDGDIVLMDYALQPTDGDIVAALIDDYESTLKAYSHEGNEITLTPIETRRHSPRTFHASRVMVQGVLVEIVRRIARRRR